MTFTTWNPGQHARPAARDATCSLVGLPDVVQCIPQQTAPAGRGKDGSEHGSSRMPITPAGSGSARQRGWQPAELQGQRAVGGDDRTPGSPATATYKRPYGLRHLVAATTCLTTAPQARHDPHQVPRLPPATCARCHPSQIQIAIVPGNFSPYRSTRADDAVGRWPAANKGELAYVPFYGSWLNRIEPSSSQALLHPLDGTDHNGSPRAGRHDPPLRRLVEPARHRPRVRKIVERAEIIKGARFASASRCVL